jgi:adenine phosphoribosyltransferase
MLGHADRSKIDSTSVHVHGASLQRLDRLDFSLNQTQIDISSLRTLIRDIPDFPKSGIVFKDITPLMADADALASAVRALADRALPLGAECVLAAEARGFLLGPALALELGAGFALARKPGKLPHTTVDAEYELEYGSGRLELHTDAIRPATRVLVHDDLLATGGTARALCDLVEQVGAQVVGCGFLVELAFLKGRELLLPYDTHALLSYES